MAALLLLCKRVNVEKADISSSDLLLVGSNGVAFVFYIKMNIVIKS